MILVDSREKKWSHIQQYFEENGIDYKFPLKLDVGDYFNTDNPTVVIDRKANLQEVCTNLMKGKNNGTRFIKECKRAKEKNIRFIVLIEGTNCKEVADVRQWKSKYSKHTGIWLEREMFLLFMAYKVEWYFCRKDQTAKKILELLEYETDGN